MDTLRNKVFIDPNKNSKYYSWITDFSCDPEALKESIKYLKDTTHRTAKINKTTLLPKKWVPLKLYKGEYYVYSPCDGIADYKIMITDSYIIEHTPFGMSANQFNSIVTIDKWTFVNSEINYYWNEKNLHIEIIDSQRGIAIFSSTKLDDNSLHFRLMVDASKVKLFPLIKNYCPGGKEWEFNFETPNFISLLDTKKASR